MDSVSAKTKLTINLREGVVEVEGSEDFVRSVYQDFKEQISRRPVFVESSDVPEIEYKNRESGEVESTKNQKMSRKKRNRKVVGADNSKVGITDYRPSFRSDLDLTGLEAFYSQFEPKNHTEKILIFATYLRDQMGINPCSADDIFTCYFFLKDQTDTPEAFVQSFRTAQSRTHFIDFVSVNEIKVSIVGNNHFNRGLKRKGGSA